MIRRSFLKLLAAAVAIPLAVGKVLAEPIYERDLDIAYRTDLVARLAAGERRFVGESLRLRESIQMPDDLVMIGCNVLLDDGVTMNLRGGHSVMGNVFKGAR